MHRYFAIDNGITDEQAGVLGERFMVIGGGGEVTPAQVVDDARPETSPTHGYFEWDNEVAAERYRESQATYYLANIVMVPAEAVEAIDARSLAVGEPDAGSASRMVRFTDVPVTESAAMVQLGAVMQRAARELESWRTRYQPYTALRPAMPWIREALEALGVGVEIRG